MEKKNKKLKKKNPIIIYTTAKDIKEAKKISKHLLEKKLISCSNVFPIKSFYYWNNKIQEEKEFVLLLKTTEIKYEKIEKEIKKIHSYDIPAIYSIKINKISNNYLKWVIDYIDI